MTIKQETADHIKKTISVLESIQPILNDAYRKANKAIPDEVFTLAEMACEEEGGGLADGEASDMRYISKLGFDCVSRTGYAANDLNKAIGQLKAFLKKHNA